MAQKHKFQSYEGQRREPVFDERVAKAAQGDHKAFAELFRLHSPWIYGKLRRMLGPRSNLEDLVQEVFLRAYRSLPNFRGQASFESWLRRICARVAYDEYRSAKTRVRLELVDVDAEDKRGGDPERREALRHLLRLVDSLPPRNRIVLVLHDIEGYTAEEIRMVVGAKSVNTVRSRLRLARAELHRLASSHPALSGLYQQGTR